MIASSSAQSWLKCGGENHIARTISLEFRRGRSNMLGSRMRFRNALGSRLFRWCSRDKHTSVQKLLQVDGVSERSKLLNKVPVLMGYSNTQYLMEQERIRRESATELISVLKEIDFAEISAKFPCIKIGDSSPIELYDDTAGMMCKETMLSGNLTNFILESGENLEKNREFADKCHPLGPSIEESSLITQNISHEPAVDSEVCPESLADATAADGNALDKSKSCLPGEPAAVTEASLESLAYATSPDGNILDKDIRSLPGTTSRQYRKLVDGGFHTIRKLLQHFPRTYADLQNPQGLIEDGQYIMFFGTVMSSKGVRIRSTLGLVEVVVGCSIVDTELSSSAMSCNPGAEQTKRIHLHLKKFFSGTRFSSPYFLNCISSKHKEGDLVYVSGKVKKVLANGHYDLKEYTIDMLEEEQQSTLPDRKPHPIYPSKAGLEARLLGQSISRALKILTPDIDPIPPEVLVEFNLANLFDAYTGIHEPKNRDEADFARRRLIFDDFFYLQLGRLFQMLEAVGSRVEKEELLSKCENHELNAVGVDQWSPLAKKLLNALPYSLTASQLDAVKEIIWDLRRPVPMNRLLQGDVGCGKTVVAFLACMEVVNSGFQAAFMVPTEILAIQHYEHLTSLLEKLDGDECKPNIALLTGSTSTRESRIIRNGLKTGEISMVIGTHTLIADRTNFSALRISVIDEQQRFGVVQRGRFNNKLYTSSSKLSDENENTSADVVSYSETFMAPHVLAMSATPIPRTLALALYGDMSLTQGSSLDIIPKQTSDQLLVENPQKENTDGKSKAMTLPDSRVRNIKDQLIKAKVYLGLGAIRANPLYLRDLRQRIREVQKVLGDASKDSDLPKNANEKVKALEQTLIKGKQTQDDCSVAVKKLRAMLHSAEEQLHAQKKQTVFLTQLAAKTLPKGLHCLPLRLANEYFSLDPGQQQFPNHEKLADPKLYHYALFSDNILATAVVVNSTVLNAKNPSHHVFHIVTDRLNYAPMRMWFLSNPPGKATIEIQNIDEFTWLNDSYSPVMKQLGSQSMIDYYFRAQRANSDSSLKYRNPKYLSVLNHLRFYLPEIYPKLDKMVFLDDDVVVKKDITGLWSINMKGKVNGAVETCGESFHRFDRYLNFSNPVIVKNFDPHACGWAFGMNVFDLVEWRRQNITETYHSWQKLNEERLLWNLGTLPPGLITFWNKTFPLNRSWHVLGLGYNPHVSSRDLENAAVIHYNGNMKPWLEIGLPKFRSYWSKYLDYDQPFLRECNINP